MSDQPETLQLRNCHLRIRVGFRAYLIILIALIARAVGIPVSRNWVARRLTRCITIKIRPR